MLVTTTGTVTTKPKKSSGGDLTIVLDRPGWRADQGRGRRLQRADGRFVPVGTTYRVTGVVGQRATKKGAPDGYRLCLRDAADVVATSPATADRAPAERPVADHPRRPGARRRRRPASRAALGRDRPDAGHRGRGHRAGDAARRTGRRIVVQDASAAIEVLLPAASAAPGRRNPRSVPKARSGLAYGAPRLRADERHRPRHGVGSRAAGPPARATPVAQEWRLVSVTGRIDDVQKLGDRWRAELLVGSTRLVVVGQPGAGIAVTALVEGRMARITGIVRRPYPTASDQRYAITPRTPADLRVHGAAVVRLRQHRRATPGGDPPSTGAGGRDRGPVGRSDAKRRPGRPRDARRPDGPGRRARRRPATDGFLLDDGTADGLVRRPRGRA